MARVTIDGRPTEIADGCSILDAMARTETTLPALCHDSRVVPAGACRLCLVEVRGMARPVPACATTIADGKAIATRTAELEAGRHEILEMFARRIPDSGGGDRLRVAMRAYDVVPRGTPDPGLVDDSHPYIRVDMTKCIECFLCERICHELQGQDTWHAVDRGGQLRLVPDTGAPLGKSSCVSCGACADACPSGAIEDRSLSVRGRPEQLTRTTCPYCGVGCELEVGTRAGRIVQIRPALDAPVNKGHLCVKGRYAFDFVDAPDRITTPLVREGDRWREVSWPDAIELVATRLAAIRDAAGPRAIGMLGSARATNEDNYVAQKLARVVLGTNNVDCCARVCHAPSAAALAAMFGTGAATSCFDDIELAATIVDPLSRHPRAVGFIYFGSAYLITAAIALARRDNDKNAVAGLVPVAGPLLWTIAGDEDDACEDGWDWLAAADGVIQLAGLYFMISGGKDRSTQQTVRLVPLSWRGQHGFALGGTF